MGICDSCEKRENKKETYEEKMIRKMERERLIKKIKEV